jgi:hypothetical protein
LEAITTSFGNTSCRALKGMLFWCGCRLEVCSRRVRRTRAWTTPWQPRTK